jgi:hypothetical protein
MFEFDPSDPGKSDPRPKVLRALLSTRGLPKQIFDVNTKTKRMI